MHHLKQFKVPDKFQSRISFCCDLEFDFDPVEGFVLKVIKDDFETFFTRTDGRRWRYRASHFCSVHLITEALFEWPSDVSDDEIEFMVQIVESIASVMDAAFIGHVAWRDDWSGLAARRAARRAARKRMFFLGESDTESDVQKEEVEKVCKDSLYLMKHANGLVKIGRSGNPRIREKTLQAEDPRLEMTHCFEGMGGCEKRLHDIFSDVRVRGEWFRLDDRHVGWISSLMELRQLSQLG